MDLLHPVETQHASEQVYHLIKDLIVQGELKAGEHLPSEQELVNSLGRSRATIREALRMLELEGLIKITPGNKGAVVTEPTPDTLSAPITASLMMKQVSTLDLLDYRDINDVAIVGWAAERRTEEDIVALNDAIRDLSKSTKDIEAYISNCKLFLQTVTACTHNPVVILMDHIVKDSLPGVIRRAYFDRANQEERDAFLYNMFLFHERVHRAIVAGDSKKAKALQKEHLDRIRINEIAKQNK